MGQITIIDRAGDAHDVAFAPDRSLMEVIRDSGIDELLALCGGCLSCATCHVFIDPEFSGLLPSMSTDEDELLDSSDHRRANSRLSCQISMHEAMDGLRATIAPED